jgi:hypothetical protein
MTGYEDYNFPAFNEATERLEDEGWSVCNPAEKGIVPGWEWEDYLRYDLGELVECDAIYTLPGWEDSRGASLEVHVAKALGLEWINSDEHGDLSPVDPYIQPVRGEVRQVSSTGGEKGAKPEAYDLIPWDALDHVARVYGFGASKYADHNWRKGYNWSLSIAAAFRHMKAYAMGEDYDPESGELHPAHAVFHMLALLAWHGDERFAQFDNRYKP